MSTPLDSGNRDVAATMPAPSAAWRDRVAALLKLCSRALALRAVTLLCRFGLTIYAAKVLTMAELGAYGLLTAAVATAVYLLGLQFYVFNLREIASTESAEAHVRQIRDQAVFHALLYGVAGVALLLAWGVLSPSAETAVWLRWVPALALAEHLSQEGYRVLVALSRGELANLIFFIRSGAWVLAWVAFVFGGGDASFASLCWFWLGGSALSVLATVLALRKLPWAAAGRAQVNWAWIGRGVKLGLLYSGIVVSFAVSQYVMRFMLDATHGPEATGVFFFFVAMASPVLTLVEAGPYALMQPRMLKLRAASAWRDYREQWRTMALGVLGGAVALLLGTALVTTLYLRWAGRPELAEAHGVFAWIGGAIFLQCAALVPQAHLFALGADRAILAGNLAAMLAAIGASVALIESRGIAGAGMSLTVAGSVYCTAMVALAWRYVRRQALA